MDIEYLQNVMGSPYVNEGVLDYLKQKAQQILRNRGNQGTPIPAPAAPVSPSSGDEFLISPQEMPYVILKAFQIIVDAAKSDESHALGLFGVDPHTKAKGPYPQLSTKWGTGPSVLSTLQEIDAPPKPKAGTYGTFDNPAYGIGYVDPDIEAKKAENEKWIYKEYPGEFLYNFHSRFSKHPGKPFTIRIPPVNVSPEIKEIPGASVEVVWFNDSGLNKIYATEIKGNVKSKSLLILKFYDHQVSAKSGATTPGNSNFFSVDKIMKASNPYGPDKLTYATPAVRNEIKGMENDVYRALMATVERKGMEFVSQGWKEKKAKEKEEAKAKIEMPTSEFAEDGSLTYFDSGTKQHVSLTQDELKMLLKGPLIPATALRKRLEGIGYFDHFKDMPVPATETQIWKDTKMALMALGHKDKESDNLMSHGWFYLKGKNPNASIWPEDINTPDFISVETFTKVCMKKPTSTNFAPPASPPTPTPTPTMPPPAPTPAPAPVSAPVTAKVTAPVSAPVIAPVTAPVSNAAKAKITDPKLKYGPIGIKRKEIEWEHPQNHQIHRINIDQIESFAAKQPKFVQALKANPEVLAKFKELNKKPETPEGGEKPKVQERIDYINPFTAENFL